MQWTVLVDIGTDWPDVIGPYNERQGAEQAADRLQVDDRVFSVEVQQMFTNAFEFFEALEDVLS